jgi:CheY-like chemotaxis protein
VLECIQATLNLFTARAKGKGFRFNYKIDDQLPHLLIGDPTRLSQILTNLVSNAVKFTTEGEIVISVEGLARDEGTIQLQFAVSDTGIGIPVAKIPQLFQPFMQVDSSATRRYGGTGLGLVISQRLAQLMGGEMWVESKVGVGSTFYFTIVCHMLSKSELQSSERPLKPFEESPNHNLAGELPLRILVAEDNRINQKVILKILERLGYQADVADNGFQVLQAVEQRPYDLILMDIQMPEMDGEEAAQRIIQSYPAGERPYIVALTANALTGDRERYLHLGMDDYISKPIQVDKLVAALQQCHSCLTQNLAAN